MSEPKTQAEIDEQFLEDFDLENMPSGEPITNPSIEDERCGFFPDITHEEYFGDPIEEGSLNNSGIKILLDEAPVDYAYQQPRLNPEAGDSVADTVAKIRGDLVHQIALGKGRGYAVGCYDSWRTAAAKEFKAAAIAVGETPVLKHQFEEAKVMAGVIVERVKRVLHGADYQTEVAVIWRETTPAGEIYCRGLLDIWCEELAIVLDPKITANLGRGKPGEEKINRHMVNMGWDYQAGFYCRGIETLKPGLANRVKFGNLMIKPEAPFTSRLLWPSYIARRTAFFEMQPALETFAECQANGVWPGYPEDGEELHLPTFVEARRLDAEIKAHD